MTTITLTEEFKNEETGRKALSRPIGFNIA